MERHRPGIFWIFAFNITGSIVMALGAVHMILGGVVLDKMKDDYDYNYRRPPGYNVTVEEQKSDLNFTVYTYNVVMVVLSGVWLFCGSCFCFAAFYWLPFHRDAKPEDALGACACLVFIEPLIGVIYGSIIFPTAQEITGTQYTLFIGTFISCIILAGLSCFPMCIECIMCTIDDCRHNEDCHESTSPQMHPRDPPCEQKRIEMVQPTVQDLSDIIADQKNNNLTTPFPSTYEHASSLKHDVEHWSDLKSIIPRKY